MTTSLSSSIDMLSLTSSTRWASDSPSDEDEIVWSLSSSAVLSSPSPPNSPLSDTADFVLVPRMSTSAAVTISATSTTTHLKASGSPTVADTVADKLAALSLSVAPQPRRVHADVPPTSTGTPPTKKGKGRHSVGGKACVSVPAALPLPSLPDEQMQRGGAPGTSVAKKNRRKKLKKLNASSSPTLPSATTAAAIGGDGIMGSTPVAKTGTKRRTKSDGTSVAAMLEPTPRRSPTAEKKKSGEATLSITSVAKDDAVTTLPLRSATGSLSEGDGDVSESSSSTTTTTRTTTTSSSSTNSDTATTGYHEAHKYMTSYLAHPPPPGNNGSALLMLQALILELGCLPSLATGKFSIPELPGTLRQAKLLLKRHAFINVGDYLAVREQGQAALQRVMHPSRKSLVREVRKGKRVPVQEVKKAGLNVLLVNTRF